MIDPSPDKMDLLDCTKVHCALLQVQRSQAEQRAVVAETIARSREFGEAREWLCKKYDITHGDEFDLSTGEITRAPSTTPEAQREAEDDRE